ncbi:AraC family transcriptional regulator [Hoeflea sp. TYP-13]|uniref:AraC family transcriptional regulator n=1 Tax=Hoeflea sp. TYP-13 TaxID=3230023 RepID=UPI0034C6D812
MTMPQNWTILAFMENPSGSDIYFHSVDPVNSPWPYHVAAGGHTNVSAKDGMVSHRYHQHTLILTLSGEGRIKVGDGVFATGAGSLVWLDTSRKYAHGAARKNQWSYIWVAVSGHGLDRLHEQIGLQENPAFDEVDNLKPCFTDIVQNLADHLPSADAAMNAQIASIVAVLFTKRIGAIAEDVSDPVSNVMRQLRKDISRDWNISSLADIAGLSPSQLFRRFRTVAGTSPISWLRQERMVLARHLLTVSAENISNVAMRCGYVDPFHFSRDFKRHNGCSPRSFRATARF